VPYNSPGRPPAPALDVIIIGGGPAGLSAALILGRCGRRVLLCDGGNPRNRVSHGVNGFLTRDGAKPEDLRRIGREDLQKYPTVEVRDIEVCDADRVEGGFEVTLQDGVRHSARKLLLATGLIEDLPDIPGFRHLWGRGVYNCPYCDGWENRDQPFAVYGLGDSGVGLAVEMLIWSRDVVLCTDGPAKLKPEDKDRLDRHGIRLIEKKLALLEGGEEDGLQRIVFKDGDALDRKALFYTYGEREPSPLVEKLGCELSDKGVIETRSYERTNVPGLYAAGDASRRVQFAIIAAAEGAAAAFAINTELYKEDFE
jgi:thioredoxin reductase